VLLKEVIDILEPQPQDVVLDATVGAGGHALHILRRITPGGILIGIDKDEHVLKIAQDKLSTVKEGKFYLFKSDFRFFDDILKRLKIKKVNKVFLDLGISSFQVDDPQRGFSFLKDGPLDMRMDNESFICAFDLVNNLTEDELFYIIKNFGEERFARKIASSIVRERKISPIFTTQQLVDIIKKSVPSYYRYGKIHPATRTFQALRIAVNRELEALEELMQKIFCFIQKGGVCAVISFHSLEDRIVKHKFKYFQKKGIVEILTKKPVVASEQEIEHNRRARSAKLRACRVLKEM